MWAKLFALIAFHQGFGSGGTIKARTFEDAYENKYVVESSYEGLMIMIIGGKIDGIRFVSDVETVDPFHYSHSHENIIAEFPDTRIGVVAQIHKGGHNFCYQVIHYLEQHTSCFKLKF